MKMKIVSQPVIAFLLLLAVQMRIITIVGQQLLMRAFFHYLALIQHNDIIKRKKGENAVGDDDGRFILQVAI